MKRAKGLAGAPFVSKEVEANGLREINYEMKQQGRENSHLKGKKAIAPT